MARWLLFSIFVGISAFTWSYSCTNILLKTKENTCVVGRSLEFAQILPTKVKIALRMESLQSTAPNGGRGLKWTSRHAYVAMAIFDSELVMDGANERGLSVGLLWFPDAKYPEISKGPPSNMLAIADLGKWLLGSFATIEEVKTGLSKVIIHPQAIADFGDDIAPGLHVIIHDATGKGLILEWLNGQLTQFDSDLGVLTNAPEFPWHVTNLRNYINLSALNTGDVSVDGSVLQPTGQGTGLLGIPGDWTPPSRFIRAAFFKQMIPTPKDSQEAVTAAIHLLNTVDIPYGTVKGTNSSDFDFTQWIVVKDLANKKIYVRTYADQNIRIIDYGAQISQLKESEKIALD